MNIHSILLKITPTALALALSFASPAWSGEKCATLDGTYDSLGDYQVELQIKYDPKDAILALTYGPDNAGAGGRVEDFIPDGWIHAGDDNTGTHYFGAFCGKGSFRVVSDFSLIWFAPVTREFRLDGDVLTEKNSIFGQPSLDYQIQYQIHPSPADLAPSDSSTRVSTGQTPRQQARRDDAPPNPFANAKPGLNCAFGMAGLDNLDPTLMFPGLVSHVDFKQGTTDLQASGTIGGVGDEGAPWLVIVKAPSSGQQYAWEMTDPKDLTQKALASVTDKPFTGRMSGVSADDARKGFQASIDAAPGQETPAAFDGLCLITQ